jgi:antirestriction protein ArdC
MNMAVLEDFRQRLTNALIESIKENDGLPQGGGWDSIRPFNPSTGTKYRGGNVLNLLLEQIKRDSDDPRWMTLRQANAAGYSVRKGAKAAYVEYWDWGQPQSQAFHKEKVDEQEQDRKPRLIFAKVFNGSDIIGLPEIKREVGWHPNELSEKLIVATGAKIEHTAGFGAVENTGHYTRGQDKIVIPPRDSFKNEGDYYATLLHELAHWAGHHSRLFWEMPDKKSPSGSPEHARKELRAEIASMFLISMIGVKGHIQNHAKHTGSWLEVLKGDKHEIFRAARDAEKIVDHIFGYAPDLREIVETRITHNLLPKETVKQKLGTEITGISRGLPNFIPPEAKSWARTGRDDPRWAAFDQTVRGEAQKFGVDETLVNKALNVIETQFTEVMNAANKYTVDDINTMLAQSIVDEMRIADIRQQQWERFCVQVRRAGADLYPMERIELALQELGGRYQQLIAKSTQEGWTKQQTDAEIRSMIFGEEGRRPITKEYVKSLIESSPAAQQAATSADSDDEFVLTPRAFSDTMSEDSEFLSDDHLNSAEQYIMDDAEIQDLNIP